MTSTGSIKAFSFSFLTLLLVGLVLGGAVIRGKHVDQANKWLQELIPDAGQFVLTYRTMDVGLRKKTSDNIFINVKKNDFIQSIYIVDPRQTPLLHYRLHDDGIAHGFDQVSAMHGDLQTVVLETRLPGSAQLVLVSKVLNFNELATILLFGLVGLGILIIYLVYQLINSNSKEEQPIVETSTTIDSDPNPQEAKLPPSDDYVEADETPQAVQSLMKKNTESEPKFLIIDKSSGVTQERFLDFRLAKELERSAENALDISLAIFHFQNLADSEHVIAAQLLLSEFSHEDLIFESGSDIFYVIMPQHDLDQGIARADLLIRKAENRFVQSGKLLLTAGLSSRNGRLLDAKRFLKEVQIALGKANIREGRIVGFRPDPVRFRNFLRHHRV